MLRKLIAIVFVSVAYSVLLLHSVIPHHHHEVDEQSASVHQYNDHDGDVHKAIDDNFLSWAFAHLQHDRGSHEITYITRLKARHCITSSIDNTVIPAAGYSITAICLPPVTPLYLSSPPVIFTPAFSRGADPRRGPPALFV